MMWVASWVWATTVDELGAEVVASVSRELGLTDLLILVKSVSGKVNYEALRRVAECSRNNPRVHAWIVCFADRSRADALPHNEAYRRYLLRVAKDLLERYDVRGIHLDYVRYVGDARDKHHYVTSFVREVRALIDSVRPGVVLSVASKAENYESKEGLRESALYYGQNYEDLAQYVDVFIPMTYYLDYNVDPVRAVAAARWIKEITGRPVVMGLQLHPGEHPETRNRIPRVEEIEVQILEAKRLGLDGVCFFRFKYLYERLSELRKVLTQVKS